MSKESLLKLYESDLKDSNDSKILAKYPHLGSAELKAELQEKIRKLKES